MRSPRHSHSSDASASGNDAPSAFEEVRRAHATELAEDYVEAIEDVIGRAGQCRVRDLAEQFGVTHVTVTRAVARLVDQGLVETEPYRPITLTERGRQLAAAARYRHEIVLRFLLSIGVSPATAEVDAEGMEHHISGETLQKLEQFLSRSEAP